MAVPPPRADLTKHPNPSQGPHTEASLSSSPTHIHTPLKRETPREKPLLPLRSSDTTASRVMAPRASSSSS